MVSWLTFVVGIIVGLLIGWLIDLLYRRAPRSEPPADADRVPDWAQPLPEPVASPELPGVVTASAVAVAAAADEDGLDVPPEAGTAAGTGVVDEAGAPVTWSAVSQRVDEVAAEREAGEPELPPAAVEPPAPADDSTPRD